MQCVRVLKMCNLLEDAEHRITHRTAQYTAIVYALLLCVGRM